MFKVLRFIWRGCYLFFEFLTLMLVLLVLYLGWVIPIPYPEPSDLSSLELEREEMGIDQYRIGENWAVKNQFGLWEVYVEGDAFERGVIYGKLLEEPVQQQELFFVDQVEKIVPNSFWRFCLRVMIGFFNRDMTDYIPEEYLMEIYGVSHSFGDEYDTSVGPKYYRILNYHAAHDIGHALKDYNMVGCSSFSVNNEFSADSSLLVGRNFDFYVGDEFSQEKVLTFVNPEEGNQFAMYSWAGLMGVVSGMNESGLSVTINASKSELPSKTKTPISILTREILQYATTIEEAVAIAKKREVFVSETIMVTSAIDNKTVLIEKSPESVDVYESDNGKIYCTNHYQSATFKDQKVNKDNIKNSDSQYRFERLDQLVSEKQPLDLNETVSILRNQKGIDGVELGMGNPKAINQLIAHHSVVFKPKEKKMWISTNPYQLGKFICYDLDEVFALAGKRDLNQTLYIDSLTIGEDPFINSQDYQNFEFYKELKKKMFDSFMIGIEFNLTELDREKFIKSNPESYVTYMTLGQYYQGIDKLDMAKKYYNLSLSKDVASIEEINKINRLLDECED